MKSYLDSHPRSPVPQVSEETEVPVPVIMKFLRQGRVSAESLPPEVVAEWVHALDEAQRLQARFADRAKSQARERGAEGEGGRRPDSARGVQVARRRSTRAS